MFGREVVPDGGSFLAWFRDRGCWLVDLAEMPVNQLQDTERRAAVERGIEPLAALLDQARPDKVVAVKRDIEDAVTAAIKRAGVEVPLIVLPFPVRQWRPVYEQGLADLLRTRPDCWS